MSVKWCPYCRIDCTPHVCPGCRVDWRGPNERGYDSYPDFEDAVADLFGHP